MNLIKSHSHISLTKLDKSTTKIEDLAKVLQTKITQIDQDIMLTKYYVDVDLQAIKKHLRALVSQAGLAGYYTSRIKIETEDLVDDCVYREGHIKLKLPIVANKTINHEIVRNAAYKYGGHMAKNPRETTKDHSIQFINFKVEGSHQNLVDMVGPCAVWLRYEDITVLEVKLEAVIYDQEIPKWTSAT